MKAEQVRAVRVLEAALAACAGQGVALFGMDDELLAYSRAKLVTAGYFGKRAAGERLVTRACREVLEKTEHESVNDHGAYVDSGGW
jgi:hypothetical protein